MRIGICGPQGAGKTTLAKSLAERLGLPIIEEQARFVAERFGVKSEVELRQMPARVQRQFQWGCLNVQTLVEEDLGEFVSDRTVIDNAAYWIAWNHANAEPQERWRYLKTAARHVSSYDLIIYCSPLTHIEDDGFRMTDKPYQDEIDLLIRTLLIGWEVKNWITVEGDPDERLRQALIAVEEMRSERKWEVALC